MDIKDTISDGVIGILDLMLKQNVDKMIIKLDNINQDGHSCKLKIQITDIK